MKRTADHFAVVMACCAGMILGTASRAAEADGTAYFESRIRPLLVKRCYECHGEKKQKGGLRLDSKAGWQKGGDSGAVIVPGDPEASLLIKAVRYADKDLQMPPKRQLVPEEISVLEHWVKIGAPDPREGRPVVARSVDFEAGRKLWAFQPVGNPQPPVLAQDHWSRSEWDRFVFARLQQAGLQPSAPADRRTLIRRATFDLTGLPPTSEEVDAFVRDTSSNAFAKVVDGMLASPHYGEHWARQWLDVARYSDTKGYVYAREEKQFVGAWPYRDWVVRSLNDDMAYDRFLLLQLAADQVESAESPHLAAMGFLTLGRRFLGVTHDIIDDRIDVVMRGTQGLSVACARCHDHKFDPISTRDYYALYGVFQSCAEQVVPCAAPPRDAVFLKELNAREDKSRAMMAQRREEQSARVRATVTEHLVAQLELEKYPEETFTQIIGPGDINPVFVRRWQRFLAEAEQRRDPAFAAWHEFAKLKPADFAKHREAAVQKLRGLAADSLNPLVARAFATAPATMREVAERHGALFAEVEKQWRALLKAEPTAKALPDENAEALRRVLYGPDSPCDVPDEHLANNEWHFPTGTVVELWKLQGEVDRWLMQSTDVPAHATILVDRAKPVTPRVFKRGNPLTKGETVPREFLQVLAGDPPTPFSKGSGRLELAQAITSPGNPLTARVMVNRVWMQHFGRGLVTTPSDFGKRADPPSHPELLDWLARRFMDDGWSVKKLHRRIMLSATYQQSSLAPSDAIAARKAQELDPDNRLLWRMNTHRLSFEEMRDAWLAATGELDLRTGGKPVELFASDNARRTLYARVDRERLPTVMRTFDFANPDLSIPQRNDTIVPQQALFGLNHPFLAARAKSLVRRAESAGNENAACVARLYELLFQRKPTAAEMAAAIAFVQPESAALAKREKPSAWQYGCGEWDEAAGRMKNFTALPLFNGTAWQGGEQWPDKKLGWVQLTATGGHPGNDRQHAVVRRWVAPHDGSYAITSTLIHEPAVGDGIRAFISHSGRGLLRSTTLHHSTEALDIAAMPMGKGDALDFIVDIRDGLNSDQFLWSPKIIAVASAGAGGDDVQSWDAQKDFTGPTKVSLSLWQQLAQTLMLTNEFVFVD
ncbi:MAG: PSD1 and planctomycete cytochrome C domain-containing protein [Chthoniobacteraceae bacterium]